MDIDLEVRLTAFDWLSEQVRLYGEVLSRPLLQQGFNFHETRIPLVAPHGIFKPQLLELPLSITTISDGPYDDQSGPEGFLHYRYRGSDPDHPDNRGLRRLFEVGRPLIYLLGFAKNKYLPTWPCYVVGDDPSRLTFTVSVDDRLPTLEYVQADPALRKAEVSDPRHAYITGLIKVRLQQRSFRERVLDAYRSQCSFCRLRHRELLDAAHIIPDEESLSSETIDNGLALCKLHHAAFDNYILGVSPDFVIHVREDVLSEDDGPVLQHALKDLHNTKLILPASQHQWPSREALDWRFRLFAAIS